jgi:uncharacterized membrane protein YdbT with pleckstrin-like domain
MQTQSFKPSPRYLTKLQVGITIVALLILLSGILTGWLIGLSEEGDTDAVVFVPVIVAIADVIWWLPTLILLGAYYRSLSYEVQDDEVIVHAGILTKSVKHVPYRTVTNLTVKRDIMDRWFFGLGSLNIQTAGMSGTTGAEESLVGLPNVQEVYEMVVTELRRFRGAMAPTAAEVEGEPVLPSHDALGAILAEVRAIRETLEKRA